MTVYDLLNKYQMTVTTAESCTGGLVASGLVDIAGISAFFKEGYVTYAPEAKERILGVPKEVIFDKNDSMKGTELYAFIEGKVADENASVGRTYRDPPNVDGYIFINTDEELMTGDIVKVRVTGAYEYDLIGEII